jgi:hypothetical protein
MFSPLKINANNDEPLVAGYPTGPTPFIDCQVREDLSVNPNYLPTAVRFFFTTGKDLHEEVTAGRPRPKDASIEETKLAAGR